jgi:hypothetical protein
MTRGRSQFASWTVRLFCAIALAFGGFASGSLSANTLSPADPVAADFADYILPDGSIPTLCVTIDDSDGSKHGTTGHLHGCDACEISLVAFLLPEAPIGPSVFARHMPDGIHSPTAPILQARAHPPNANPRAPPVSFLIG